MKSTKVAAIGLLAIALGSAPALASSTDWFETQGGRVRLVTSGKPDANGQLHGILDIDLDPGWKTYWRDPGDAGVPPQLDISASTNISSAEFDFPVPQHHDDGYSKWAGYDQSVALPITFHLKAAGEPAMIDAHVFLGICETICIPVSTKLVLDPTNDPDNADDAALVSAAQEALPAAEQPGFNVKIVSKDEKSLLVEASFPGNPTSADFFIAGENGYSFAAPKRVEKDGKTLFSVEILNRPAQVPAEGGLHYTLVSDAGSVSGILPYM
ncbi:MULTISPECIES: protein-disulfide reductase DsbD domain-containing protein [unclassified Mesorhizobium]|uniref:protein-disulfide reductase DsbD domain-containing protein n=1 Tax=unclassified Mesorhizobium TaxID=325217 RepID=UPI0030156F8D